MIRTKIRWDDDTDEMVRLNIAIDRFQHEPTDYTCDVLCTMLILHELDFDMLDSIFSIATMIDPTESGHAARIRDTMRDNYPADALDGIL